MLGLSADLLLQVHVVLSLLQIPVGLYLALELCRGRAPAATTLLFFALAALTSLTGFPLPPFGFDPPRAIGILTLLLLAASAFAFYSRGAIGLWRPVFVIGSIAALYLDIFVAIVQAFQKLPAFQRLAPTQSEPPFVILQVAALALCIVIGFYAVRRFGRIGAHV